jgi:hypothetical protein
MDRLPSRQFLACVRARIRGRGSKRREKATPQNLGDHTAVAALSFASIETFAMNAKFKSYPKYHSQKVSKVVRDVPSRNIGCTEYLNPTHQQ